MATEFVYQKVNDKTRFDLTRANLIIGNCESKSFQTWIKLKNAGAKRMRGKRNLEVELEANGDSNCWHYWVEVKDIVYDESCGITQIMKKAIYYNVSGMVYSEVAPYGAFFKNDFGDDMPESDMRRMGNKMNNPNTPKEYLIELYQIMLEDEEEQESKILEKSLKKLKKLISK